MFFSLLDPASQQTKTEDTYNIAGLETKIHQILNIVERMAPIVNFMGDEAGYQKPHFKLPITTLNELMEMEKVLERPNMFSRMVSSVI